VRLKMADRPTGKPCITARTRAAATASDHHAVRTAFQSVSDLIDALMFVKGRMTFSVAIVLGCGVVF